MITPIHNEEIRKKNLSEIKSKIKDVFGQLRDCINNREKILLENIQKIADTNRQSEIINKMLNEMINFKKNLNNICKDLNQKYFQKYEKNMSNMIEEINSDKKEIEKIEELKFYYDENILNDILNKIRGFGELKQNSDFLFKWKTGPNYILSENNLIATKNNGGNNYNCNILGDVILPKNDISKWKIRLKSFVKPSLFGGWGILIGVGPSNLNQNEQCLYNKTWTFICHNSCISIKSGRDTNYKVNKRLKEGDIVEVIMNNINGELSFCVNEENYGVACKIPLDIDLSPVVIIYDQGNSIELLNK